MYAVLFPLWGDDLPGAVGLDAEKARRLGRWVGKRYGSRSHVMWAACGEYDAINGFRLPITAEQKAVINALAEGIREGTGGKQLMTIHPGVARDSSLDFHGEKWLDLNMLQSGHQDDSQAHGLAENWEMVAHDWARTPVKPVVDGEPMYEDTPDAVWAKRSIEGPRAGAEVMRRKAYWAVFAGACGHTYGHNDVCIFFTPSSPGEMLTPPQGSGQCHPWEDMLEAPGAVQMKHLRALMESLPFLKGIPDQSLLASPAGTGGEHKQAMRASDGSYALVYLPAGGTVEVHVDKLATAEVACRWFDPRTGAYEEAGLCSNRGARAFTAPGQPSLGNDWVLVLTSPMLKR